MFPNMKSTAEIIKETREAAILECINLCKLRKNSFCYNLADKMLDNVVSDMEKLVAPAKPQEDLSIYYDPTLKDAIAKVRAKKAAESQRLAPAQALKLQEAHKAHGPDVTLGTVQKMYDRVMKSLITGKGSNGGVQYDIKPKERKELQAQADRLTNDLSLFGVQQEQATGVAKAEMRPYRCPQLFAETQRTRSVESDCCRSKNSTA